ncbi:MAG: carboxy-S-adenosyl-L-methionine synthase CmoA [Endozoicomonadaceae bacterium]|nr:carboxy-S-adenosyl-L-methionine synthase CmoA [Endozoicomonadaceae bacterium]MBE8233079.1 carboxy-S-adenosyl-L-methionine synthase CmoA [Endozoicomonadaceae bacterium]
MNDAIDTLYAKKLDIIPDFQFDELVAQVFDNMITRSVPGYEALLNCLTLIAQKYVKPNTNVYDLGCSLGKATLAIQSGIINVNCHIIGLDKSIAMIQRCQAIPMQQKPPITFIQANICQTPLTLASMIVLNFTLQFIPITQRTALLEKIYQALIPGSALIISEKLQFSYEKQAILDSLHQAYKQQNHYSDLEISQKREAIANQLIPETLNTHTERLKKIGFKTITVFFQHFNFISMLAIK